MLVVQYTPVENLDEENMVIDDDDMMVMECLETDIEDKLPEDHIVISKWDKDEWDAMQVKMSVEKTDACQEGITKLLNTQAVANGFQNIEHACKFASNKEAYVAWSDAVWGKYYDTSKDALADMTVSEIMDMLPTFK